MHLTVADEFGLFESWDEPQDTLLLYVFEICLEANHIVQGACQVVLSQLHDRMRPPAGARIFETDRAHGAKCECLLTPCGKDFDRQATLKISSGADTFGNFNFNPAQRNLLRLPQGLDELVILFFIQGAVDVVAFVRRLAAATRCRERRCPC